MLGRSYKLKEINKLPNGASGLLAFVATHGPFTLYEIYSEWAEIFNEVRTAQQQTINKSIGNLMTWIDMYLM